MVNKGKEIEIRQQNAGEQIGKILDEVKPFGGLTLLFAQVKII